MSVLVIVKEFYELEENHDLINLYNVETYENLQIWMLQLTTVSEIMTDPLDSKPSRLS